MAEQFAESLAKIAHDQAIDAIFLLHPPGGHLKVGMTPIIIAIRMKDRSCKGLQVVCRIPNHDLVRETKGFGHPLSDSHLEVRGVAQSDQKRMPSRSYEDRGRQARIDPAT